VVANTGRLVLPRVIGTVALPLAAAGLLWTAWEVLGPGYRATGPAVLIIAATRLQLWSRAVAEMAGEV
jgi:uncharacterized protein YaaW (UPF0174 family)